MLFTIAIKIIKDTNYKKGKKLKIPINIPYNGKWRREIRQFFKTNS